MTEVKSTMDETWVGCVKLTCIHVHRVSINLVFLYRLQKYDRLCADFRGNHSCFPPSRARLYWTELQCLLQGSHAAVHLVVCVTA